MGQDIKSSQRYKVACGRRQGRAHVADKTECQDFVSVRRSAHMACIALADGAGSRKLSGVGAEVVVRTALRLLTADFDRLFEMCKAADSVPARRHIHQRLMERLQRAAVRVGCSVDALASTLLFAAHKGDRFLAGHIGDGVIAQLDGTRSPQTLSPPENGEYANTTIFVTDANAAERFRIYYGQLATQPLGFALMSDGCAESLYEKKSGNPAPAVTALLDWNARLSRKKMDGVLAANLEQTFTRKSADDCSLALMSIAR